MSWVSRGLASAIALALAALNVFLLQNHCDFIKGDIEKGQHLHFVAGALALVGVCLHVLMLRGCLKNPICRIVTAGVQLAAAGAFIGAAYFVLMNPCKVLGFAHNLSLKALEGDSNIFKIEDGKMITVFILDLVAAFVVGGSTFLRAS